MQAWCVSSKAPDLETASRFASRFLVSPSNETSLRTFRSFRHNSGNFKWNID